MTDGDDDAGTEPGRAAVRGVDVAGRRPTGLLAVTRRAIDAVLSMEREGVDRKTGTVRASSGPVSVEADYDVRLGPWDADADGERDADSNADATGGRPDR